jgi:hypothetical protein
MPVVDSFTNSRINMLPHKLSGKKPVVPDNYLFGPAAYFQACLNIAAICKADR